MAKIAFSALVSDARGKLGGLVAAKNRVSNYMRVKVTPTNPKTSFQTGVRARLSQWSIDWSALADAIRDAFEDLASGQERSNQVGGKYKMTGKNLYVALQSNLTEIGESTLTVAPTFVTIVEPTITGVASDNSASEMIATVTGSNSANKYIVRASAPQSAGTRFFKGKSRNIAVVAHGSIGSYNAYTAYVTKFGAPALGKKIQLEVIPVVIATGQKGLGSKFVFTVAD
jgi:hypothetical protein